MVLVFILLSIFILLLALSFIVLLSTLRIEIKNLEVTNMNLKEESQDAININSKQPNLSNNNIKSEQQNTTNYAVIVSLHLLNRIKWFSIHLNDEKMRKLYNKMQLEKIDLKKIEKDFRWEDLKTIKKLQIKLSYLKFKTEVGVESPVITAFLVSILSSFVAIFLPYLAVDMKKERYQYEVLPIYQNKNLYKIQLNCIIQVKMVHIISVVYNLYSSRKMTVKEIAV